ncbi:hypothetical protein ABQF35_10945 [Mycobacterium syngnathidarum]
MKFGEIGLFSVESGAAFGQEKVEELAGRPAVAITDGWAKFA